MGKGEHLGEFETILLLAVAGLEGEASGAAIHERILESTGRDVSLASVYVTLSRLEKKGFVTTEVDTAHAEAGGRLRKLFLVTPVAVRALQDTRRAHDRLWSRLDFEPTDPLDAAEGA